MPSDAEIAELNQLCAGAKVMTEADSVYVFMPALKLPKGCTPATIDALLRIKSPLTDYPTRLFFTSAFASPKAVNWTPAVVILQRQWTAYSWKDIQPDRPLIELVAEHLRALV